MKRKPDVRPEDAPIAGFVVVAFVAAAAIVLLLHLTAGELCVRGLLHFC